MKVTIELTDRIIDAASGLLMVQAVDSDKEEQQVSEAVARMKQMADPYLLDTDMLGAKDGRQLLVGIGCLVLAQVLKETGAE